MWTFRSFRAAVAKGAVRADSVMVVQRWKGEASA
jgi:hypothetical protein